MTAAPTATASPTSALPQPTATATAAPPPTDTPVPAPTRTPSPAAVFVRSHTSYALDSQLVVVGELLSGIDFDAFGARVRGRFYNSGGARIAAAEAQTALGKLESGRTAPFRMLVDIDPAEINRYELSVSFDDISINEYREPEVSAVAVVERNGRLAVVGTLRNRHEMALSSVAVVAVFYDEDGEVVDVAEGFLFGEVIAPGADLAFEIPLRDAGKAYAYLRVLAQGLLSLR